MSLQYVRKKPTTENPDGDILFVAGAIQAPAGSLGYDEELDPSSVNAVENRVVTLEVNRLKSSVADLDERVDDLEQWREDTDSEPTRLSEDLVKSGGVWQAVQDAIAEGRVERVLTLPVGMDIKNKVYEYNGDIYVGSRQTLTRLASYAELEASRPVEWGNMPALPKSKIYATDEEYEGAVKTKDVQVFVGKENDKYVELATKEYADRKQALSEKGQANGYAPLDQNGHIPTKYLPTSAIVYMGTWDATSGAYPTVGSGEGGALVTGDYYIVSTAGTFDGKNWDVGDWAMYSSTGWTQLDQSSDVKSVNGQTGSVTLTASDIETENSGNMYSAGDTVDDALTEIDTYVNGTVKTVNSVGVTVGTRNVALTTSNIPNASALRNIQTTANASQAEINAAIDADSAVKNWGVGNDWILRYS